MTDPIRGRNSRPVSSERLESDQPNDGATNAGAPNANLAGSESQLPSQVIDNLVAAANAATRTSTPYVLPQEVKDLITKLTGQTAELTGNGAPSTVERSALAAAQSTGDQPRGWHNVEKLQAMLTEAGVEPAKQQPLLEATKRALEQWRGSPYFQPQMELHIIKNLKALQANQPQELRQFLHVLSEFPAPHINSFVENLTRYSDESGTFMRDVFVPRHRQLTAPEMAHRLAVVTNLLVESPKEGKLLVRELGTTGLYQYAAEDDTLVDNRKPQIRLPFADSGLRRLFDNIKPNDLRAVLEVLAFEGQKYVDAGARDYIVQAVQKIDHSFAEGHRLTPLHVHLIMQDFQPLTQEMKDALKVYNKRHLSGLISGAIAYDGLSPESMEDIGRDMDRHNLQHWDAVRPDVQQMRILFDKHLKDAATPQAIRDSFEKLDDNAKNRFYDFLSISKSMREFYLGNPNALTGELARQSNESIQGRDAQPRPTGDASSSDELNKPNNEERGRLGGGSFKFNDLFRRRGFFGLVAPLTAALAGAWESLQRNRSSDGISGQR